MNDTVMSIIAIFVAATLMFLFPLMSTADRSDDISQQAVQTATTEFVDKIRSTGKVTQDDWDSFEQKIGATGNSYDVQIQAQISDTTSAKKTSQADVLKTGEGTAYTVQTLQVQNEMEKTGSYKFKEGDIVSVTVKNTNKTMAQVLKNFFYQVTGNDTYDIAAQHSGSVNVTAK